MRPGQTLECWVTASQRDALLCGWPCQEQTSSALCRTVWTWSATTPHSAPDRSEGAGGSVDLARHGQVLGGNTHRQARRTSGRSRLGYSVTQLITGCLRPQRPVSVAVLDRQRKALEKRRLSDSRLDEGWVADVPVHVACCVRVSEASTRRRDWFKRKAHCSESAGS